MQSIVVFFPCDYFDNARSDDIYEAERRACVLNCIPFVLVDYEAMRIVSRPSEAIAENSTALWRGWMLDDVKYAAFCDIARSIGAAPLTTPAMYSACHRFPEYAPSLDASVPGNVLAWDSVPAGSMEDASFYRDFMVRIGDGAFVKDYVKSAGEEKLRFLRPDMSDADILSVVNGVRDWRGELFDGGIVVKEAAELECQMRFFLLDGEIVASGSHDENGVEAASFPRDYVSEAAQVARRVRIIGADGAKPRFYTVDIARCASKSGRAVVVECGDGQVSELPEGSVESFYKKLASRF